jgi:hypothetical protein
MSDVTNNLPPPLPRAAFTAKSSKTSKLVAILVMAGVVLAGIVTLAASQEAEPPQIEITHPVDPSLVQGATWALIYHTQCASLPNANIKAVRALLRAIDEKDASTVKYEEEMRALTWTIMKPYERADWCDEMKPLATTAVETKRWFRAWIP